VSFSSTVRLTSVAANDAFVAKYSSAGVLVWVKGLADSAASAAYSIAINAKTGNLVVGGYDSRVLTRVPSGGHVVRLNRLNNDGTLTSTTTMIGADLSYASGVALDDSDAVYLTGSFKESLTLPNATKLTSASDQNGIPNLGGFVAKLAKDNSVIWAQTITTSGVDTYLDGLVLGTSGAVFVAGTTSRAGASGIGLLTGYGPTGTKSFSLTASSYADDYVSPLTTDGRGGVCWGGIFSNTLTLGTVSLSSPNGISLYVANVDASGTTKWAISAGGYNPNTVVKGIAAGPNGDVEITGTYGGGCTFGSTNLSTSGYRELFVARLDAIVGPAIVSPPSNQSAAIGQNVTFAVTVSGSGLSYQWQKNGANIPGATNPTLVLSNVQSADAGNYSVVITNGGGSIVSPAATLSVSAVVSRLANISVRAPAGTGDQTLILGFYIGGAGSKQVLIRGIGPTLAQYGVSGVLADPQLKLFNTANTQINQNDDWGGSTALANAFASVNDFALPANSKDAALLVSLPLNGYTAQVNGAGTSTGVALIEAYEADIGTPAARFTALSARNQVGTGENIIIAGFVVTGNAPKTLLIRGIGPTLANYGVSGVLADPKLELYAGNTKIYENDNWGGTVALSNAFTATQAFPLPANSKDAALLVTLQPGVYSAQVSGVGGTTGVALVEVYEMP
jgi:nitrogen fixation protein